MYKNQLIKILQFYNYIFFIKNFNHKQKWIFYFVFKYVHWIWCFKMNTTKYKLSKLLINCFKKQILMLNKKLILFYLIWFILFYDIVNFSNFY
ncbi:hypothetical protein P271_651 [Malacoplasma iowae DK-CPA]|uniref:Transmembrane protein n=1 Tax=Malacoplasma iowae DK-CPA TaxID=1394179 RepID=A0A084U4A3_MALIO|nr:hypothetical protein P271_651 [Malacoplasma iowae DK-CPA]